MTGLSTVPLGWRRGEGAPPYRDDVAPAKILSYTNIITDGADEEHPYNTLPKQKNISLFKGFPEGKPLIVVYDCFCSRCGGFLDCDCAYARNDNV